MARLSARDFGRVSKAIENLPPFAGRGRIREAVGQVAVAREAGIDGAALVDTLASLAQVRPPAGEEAIARAISSWDELGLTKARQKAFAKNIERILRSRIVRGFAKADSVITDHSKVFAAASILSDIRPVFGDEVQAGPDAAVLINMLKLEYADAIDGRRALYIALDQADLLELREVIDRGLAKTRSLQRFLGDAGLDHYEHQEVNDEDGSRKP